MKKILIAVLIVGVIGIGVFLFMTRGVEVTQDVNTASEQIAPSESLAVYRISQDESKASFYIDEVLSGKDKTVLGETNQIAGDVSISLQDLSTGTLGEILINARTFKTDNEYRDGAIARAILKTESSENEFIRFSPTEITPLNPGAYSDTEPALYQVKGDLTIAGVTKSITFSILLQSINENALRATGETVILRSDFAITIPSVEKVASVSNEVTLKVDIVARRVTQ